MSPFTLASFAVSIPIYIQLCRGVYRGKVHESFATWILWAALDSINAASTIYQHGNYLIPLSYAISSAVASAFILRSKNFTWTWFETMIVALIVACIIVWARSGAYNAIIASTIAVIIASGPLILECYQEPGKKSFLASVGNAFASFAHASSSTESSPPKVRFCWSPVSRT